jgi:hypothetical protein
MPLVDDPSGAEDAQGVRVARHVQLVARRPVEGPTAVRSDLRTDSRVSKQGKRTPSGGSAPEVEVESPGSPG